MIIQRDNEVSNSNGDNLPITASPTARSIRARIMWYVYCTNDDLS